MFFCIVCLLRCIIKTKHNNSIFVCVLIAKLDTIDMYIETKLSIRVLYLFVWAFIDMNFTDIRDPDKV